LTYGIFVGVIPSPGNANATGIAEVNASSIWRNATALEDLGSAYPAYRCAGSNGANASSDWILERYQELGLEAWSEEFEFYGWDLASKPSMEVTFQDGSENSKINLSTFQAEHFSYPTSLEGVEGDVVLLPLPSTGSYASFSTLSYNSASWKDIDIHDRIVIVGREIRWNPDWEGGLAEKLQEGPKALIFYYSQTWSSSWEVMYSASSGGRPLSSIGSYLHYEEMPSGHLDNMDSEWLLGKMDEGNVTARVLIDSKEGIWTQRNVVACIEGEVNNSEQVLLTAHYDSVMDGGFCDNALSVATVIEVASQLKDLKKEGVLKPANTILFIAFTGEELGLIGSSYYYGMHTGEVESYKAILNIDCLGAGSLVRTGTEEHQGIDLDQIVDQAASKIGISSTMEDGASDHQSFLDPYQVASQMQFQWNLSPGISPQDVGVPSSISLFSTPLAPIEPYYGQLGWIHTSHDTSSFCSSSNWVSESNLKKQVDVVVDVCVELIGGTDSPIDETSNIPLSSFIIAAVVVSAIVILALALKFRKPHDK